jgi:hypothetical protein
VSRSTPSSGPPASRRGLARLLERFPDARVLAPGKALARARFEATEEGLRNYWHTCFPGEIPDDPVLPALREEELVNRHSEIVTAGHVSVETYADGRPWPTSSRCPRPSAPSSRARESPCRSCVPRVVATEFHQRQGIDLSAVPRMTPGDVVTASLRGLELGETVCAPGVQDASLLQAIFQADLAAFGEQSPELAKRYRAVEPRPVKPPLTGTA